MTAGPEVGAGGTQASPAPIMPGDPRVLSSSPVTVVAREPLSVVVITRNESRNLARCLRSVEWADEVVVVDSESTDGTIEIARRFGAKVRVEPWRGFSEQKNFAVALAAHRWVLSLDADEWLGPEGGDEIRRALESPRADGYLIDRKNAFAGRFVEHVWSPDWHLRLFLRDRGRFEGGRVHESFRLHPGAKVLRLASPLYHLTYRSVDDYVERMNRYTGLNARTLRERGRRFHVTKLVLSPGVTFLKLYVLKRGFLDGVRGLVVAAGSAYSVFLKYAKLWELERERDPAFSRLVPPTDEDPDPGAVPAGPRENGTRS